MITKRSLSLLLALFLLQGLPAIYALLHLPSKETYAFAWGYSLPRLGLAGLAGVVWGLFLVVWLLTILPSHRLEVFYQRVNDWLQERPHLADTLVVLAGVSLGGLAGIAFLSSPWSLNLDVMRAVFERGFGLAIWFELNGLELLGLLVISFPQSIRTPGFFQPERVFTELFVIGLLGLTLFHWWVLVFREAIFTGIKGWYWQFHALPFRPRDGLFLIISGIVFGVLVWVIRHPNLPRIGLVLLMLVGVSIQVGFGYIAGGGFEALRAKYVDSTYTHYALQASDRPPIYYALTHYEEKYGRAFALKTKPPGTIFFYLAAQKLVQSFSPQSTFDGRFLALTNFLAISLPILAVAVLLPLAWLGRRLLGSGSGLLPAAFFLLCPNLVLMTLMLDQALFPLLFLVGVVLILLAVEHNSVPLALLTGLYIYGVIYFSFSLLPLILIVFLFPALDIRIRNPRPALRQNLTRLAGLMVGLLMGYLLFRVFLNYDFFVRYASALEQHREHKRFLFDLGSLLKSIFINNVEMTMWSGVPVMLLAGVQGIRSLLAVWRKKALPIDWLASAFALTYLATNLLGQTRSEVGRLWLFMLPLLALLAVNQIKSLFNKSERWFLLFALLQWISVFFTYKFQDFY